MNLIDITTEHIAFNIFMQSECESKFLSYFNSRYFQNKDKELLLNVFNHHADFFFEGQIKHVYLPFTLFKALYRDEPITWNAFSDIMNQTNVLTLPARQLFFIHYVRHADFTQFTNKQFTILLNYLNDISAVYAKKDFLYPLIQVLPIEHLIKYNLTQYTGIPFPVDRNSELLTYIMEKKKVSPTELNTILSFTNHETAYAVFDYFFRKSDKIISFKSITQLFPYAKQHGFISEVHDYIREHYLQEPHLLNNTECLEVYETMFTNHQLTPKDTSEFIQKIRFTNHVHAILQRMMNDNAEFIVPYLYDLLYLRHPKVNAQILNLFHTMPDNVFFATIFSLDIIKNQNISFEHAYLDHDGFDSLIEQRFQRVFGESISSYIQNLKKTMGSLGVKINTEYLRNHFKTLNMSNNSEIDIMM